MTHLNAFHRWTARPLGPGQFLSDLLSKVGVTQEDFADAVGTSRFSISQIVNGKRKVTMSMAFRIAKATNTSVDVWLNLQRDVDASEVYSRIEGELQKVRVVRRFRSDAEMIVEIS